MYVSVSMQVNAGVLPALYHEVVDDEGAARGWGKAVPSIDEIQCLSIRTFSGIKQFNGQYTNYSNRISL